MNPVRRLKPAPQSSQGAQILSKCNTALDPVEAILKVPSLPLQALNALE